MLLLSLRLAPTVRNNARFERNSFLYCAPLVLGTLFLLHWALPNAIICRTVGALFYITAKCYNQELFNLMIKWAILCFLFYIVENIYFRLTFFEQQLIQIFN